MKVIKTWFRGSENLDDVPVRDMNLMIDEVNNNAIGIQAGSICTIGYGVIGQVS